jgi:hypothetical protein
MCDWVQEWRLQCILCESGLFAFDASFTEHEAHGIVTRFQFSW